MPIVQLPTTPPGGAEPFLRFVPRTYPRAIRTLEDESENQSIAAQLLGNFDLQSAPKLALTVAPGPTIDDPVISLSNRSFADPTGAAQSPSNGLISLWDAQAPDASMANQLLTPPPILLVEPSPSSEANLRNGDPMPVEPAPQRGVAPADPNVLASGSIFGSISGTTPIEPEISGAIHGDRLLYRKSHPWNQEEYDAKAPGISAAANWWDQRRSAQEAAAAHAASLIEKERAKADAQGSNYVINHPVENTKLLTRSVGEGGVSVAQGLIRGIGQLFGDRLPSDIAYDRAQELQDERAGELEEKLKPRYGLYLRDLYDKPELSDAVRELYAIEQGVWTPENRFGTAENPLSLYDWAQKTYMDSFDRKREAYLRNDPHGRDLLRSGEASIALGNGAADYVGGGKQWLQETIPVDPVVENSLAGEVIRNVGQNAPVIAAGIVTRNPEFAGMLGWSQNYSANFDEIRRRLIAEGKPEEYATRVANNHALGIATVSQPLEYLENLVPIRAFTKAADAAKPTRLLSLDTLTDTGRAGLRGGLVQMPVEFAQTGIEGVGGNMATRHDKPFGEVVDEMGRSALIAPFSGGTMSGATSLAGNIAPRLSEAFTWNPRGGDTQSTSIAENLLSLDGSHQSTSDLLLQGVPAGENSARIVSQQREDDNSPEMVDMKESESLASVQVPAYRDGQESKAPKESGTGNSQTISGNGESASRTASTSAPKLRIDINNIGQYAGNVDVSAMRELAGRSQEAFEMSGESIVVPIEKLLSNKNELEDAKFKQGLKPDPRQTAANWLVKAIQGDPSAKRRMPLDVYQNEDGTYSITDGNATAQAAMLAGWKELPVIVHLPPANDPRYDYFREGLDRQYALARDAKPELDRITTEIAEQFGGRTLIPNELKGREKASAKVHINYRGNATVIKDLARTTIEARNVEEAGRIVKEIERRFGISAKRNEFANDPPDGYRDALLNPVIKGVTLEMQVHIPQILKAKELLHDLYNARIKVEQGAEKADRPLTPEEGREIDRLNALMKAGYDAALGGSLDEARRIAAAFTNSRNVSPETSPSPRRAEETPR